MTAPTYRPVQAGQLSVGDTILNVGDVASVRSDGVFRLVEVASSSYSLATGRGISTTTLLVLHQMDLVAVEVDR